MIKPRTLVLAAAVLALPLSAMAQTSTPASTPAPTDTTAPATHSTSTHHTKKPVHHVNHKTTHKKPAPTNTQS